MWGGWRGWGRHLRGCVGTGRVLPDPTAATALPRSLGRGWAQAAERRPLAGEGERGVFAERPSSAQGGAAHTPPQARHIGGSLSASPAEQSGAGVDARSGYFCRDFR